MPAAFRLSPPSPARPVIRRARLLATVQQRWEHAVVAVVGAAGFGKTTLLTEAMAENQRAPRGDDRWLALTPADGDPEVLAAGLAAALDADPGLVDGAAPHAAAKLLADEVWRRSPRHVCIVLDDLHEIRQGSGSAELLARLVDLLPGNGHLLAACRVEPPFPLARLVAQGRATRVDEADLLFDDDEVDRFAEARAVDPSTLGAVGGWPALLELRASTSSGFVERFLADEVLAGRRPADVRTLAVLAAIGGGDAPLLAAAVGEPVDLPGLVADLPLVSTGPGGWCSVHQLWSEALADRLGAEEVAEARRRAGVALLDRDPDRATALLIDAGAGDELRAAIGQRCRSRHLPASPDGLLALRAALPPDLRDGPEGALLLGIAHSAHDPVPAIEHLRDAIDGFAARDDGDGHLAALEHLAVLGHWRQDQALLLDLFDGVQRLDAAGTPGARPLLALGTAVVADAGGDAAGSLAALDQLEPGALGGYWSAQVSWLRGTALLALGHPDAARPHAEAARAAAGPAVRGAMGMLLVNVIAHAGDLTGAVAALPPVIDDLVATGNAHMLSLGHGHAAGKLAHAGLVDEARAHLDLAQRHARAAGGPDLPGRRPPPPGVADAVLTAEATIAAAEGDDGRAAELIAAALGGRDVGRGRDLYGDLRRVGLLYVLHPPCRAWWDAAELGPCYEIAHDLAVALVALRERGDPAPAAQLTRRHWELAPPNLPVPWIAELAIAGVAARPDGGRPTEAGAALTRLGDRARPALRRLGARGSPAAAPVRKAAAAALTTLPAPPAAPLEIAVLGPAELRRDGVPVAHPHWRRERVRSLLCHLVAGRVAPREQVAAALWPDLDAEAAGRNLRVTLSYLGTVLEPDRAEGEPSFFVRADAGSLRLVDDPLLRVDAWEMEVLLDQAEDADRAGLPADALDRYRRACACYRGPYLVDAGYEDWALPERDRLRARFVAGAVRAAELSLTGGEPTDALALAVHAIEAEPYSEPAHRVLVAAHLGLGDRAAAVRAMHACHAMLDGLGLGPDDETSMLERRLVS